MKIGIITFHYNNNFGAVLQCYALQCAIKGLGHEVEVLNYIPNNGEKRPFWRGWNLKSGHFVKTFRKRFLQVCFERGASRAFDNFRDQYFSLTGLCVTLHEFRELAARYDAVVCGSDQVWVFERPTPYFLDLGPQFSGRRVSYAACCGHDRQRADKYCDVGRLVADFDAISVRNYFSKNIIGKLVDLPVSVVADPTLLVEFDDLMERRDLPFSEYILVYSLSEDSKERQCQIINSIRRKVGDLPVVSVVANSCPQKSPYADLHIYDACPRQWIWLITNASFVYTDSFHGALFCVKYRKPFLVDYKEEWRSLRLLDAAERYDFENHVISTLDDIDDKVEILDCDFTHSHQLIALHVEESLTFMEGALAE